jgi:hypothetical protein
MEHRSAFMPRYTDHELMTVAAAAHLASLQSVEQLGFETKHRRRNRAALFLIGVEQLIRGAASNCRQ